MSKTEKPDMWILQTSICVKIDNPTKEVIKLLEAHMKENGIVPLIPGKIKDGSYYVTLSAEHEGDLLIWGAFKVNVKWKLDLDDENSECEQSETRWKHTQLAMDFERSEVTT